MSSDKNKLSWYASGQPRYISNVLAYVERVAESLDSNSRYVTELKGVLNGSYSVDEYLARLKDLGCLSRFRDNPRLPSCGTRGRAWVDVTTWSSMDPYEQTLANMVTGESKLMWCANPPTDYFYLGDIFKRIKKTKVVLSVPCSTGKEPYSIVIAALLQGFKVTVVGVDRQPAYLNIAQTGLLMPNRYDCLVPETEKFFTRTGYTGQIRATHSVLRCCRFQIGDILSGYLPVSRFPLVVCRNFLGYFRGTALLSAAAHILDKVSKNGFLLLDPYVVNEAKFHPLSKLLRDRGFRRLFPDAHYFTRDQRQNKNRE